MNEITRVEDGAVSTDPTKPTKLTNPNAPGIEVYFAYITPEGAKELLKLNTKGQRTVSAATVESYATDMGTHDWDFNGDTIKISNTNELIDGQHRLSSIILSQEPQVMLVVWGLDPDVMETIDSGRKRTFADQLKRKSVSRHTLTAAIISRSWWWFRGNYGARNVGRVEKPLFLGTNPSNAQKFAHMAAVEAKLEISFEAAAAFGHKAADRRPGISASTWGLAWVILTSIDRARRAAGDESDLREEFFHEILVEAKSSKMGYAIQALHNRLNRTAKGELDNIDQLDMLFEVFNRWYNNQELTTLRKPPRPLRWNLLQMPEGFQEIQF